MKLYPHLFLLLLLPSLAYSQAGEWTWVKGDSTVNSTGSFGIEGVPSPSNTPPALYAPGFWTDTAGNLWMYGGATMSGYAIGTLWKFDPNIMMWTWMNGDTLDSPPYFANASGVFDPLNDPGGLEYGIFTWVDKKNHLWMYGGASDLSASSDLWQYDPAINQWAWMNGPQGAYAPPVYGTKLVGNAANTPGGRWETNASWIDNSGNLWLFGGLDDNLFTYNDMWRYNVTTGNWAWMSGSKNANDPGSYGPLGVSSLNYYPSSRSSNLHWQDDSDIFWMAGGGIFFLDNFFIDVWKFDPALLEWTLVKGSSALDSVNVASANCQANMSNQEGGRCENRATWKVCDGLIVNYGGFTGNWPEFIQNDLWGFLPQENEWLEINEYPLTGSYGTQGVASAQNYPTGRCGSCAFTDKNHNLWMFGGIDSSFFTYNDLWKYVLNPACFGNSFCSVNCNLSTPVITTNVTTVCPTDSTQICAPSGFSSYTWNNNSTGKCIEAKSAGNYYVTVTDNSGCTAESNHIGIIVHQSPPVSISLSGDTLRVYNETNVQWYLNDNPIPGATQNIYIAHTFGNYTVSVTDSNGCTSFSTPIVYTGIENINDENISIYPNPLAAGSWQLAVGNNLIGAQIEIIDDNGRIVYQSQIKNLHSEIDAQFAGGVYLLRVTNGAGVTVRKLVKL